MDATAPSRPHGPQQARAPSGRGVERPGWSCRGPSALPSLSLFPSPYKKTRDLVGSENNSSRRLCSSTSWSRRDFSQDIQSAPGLGLPLRGRGIRRAQCHSWKAQNTDLGSPACSLRPLPGPRTQSPGAKSAAEFVDCRAGAAIRGAAGSARCPPARIFTPAPGFQPRAPSLAAAADATAGQRQRRLGARRGTGVEVAPVLGWAPLVTGLQHEVQRGPNVPCRTAFPG